MFVFGALIALTVATGVVRTISLVARDGHGRVATIARY